MSIDSDLGNGETVKITSPAGSNGNLGFDWETVTCALCGSGDSTLLFREKDLRYENTPRAEFTLVRCSGCGLRYLNPRPTDASLSAFYPEIYYAARPGEEHSSAGSAGLLRRIYPPRADRQLREKVDRALAVLSSGDRFIEVGPAAGQFLAALSRLGYSGVGVERSRTMVRHIREVLRLPCFSPDEFDAAAHGPVRLIALWNVFEHLSDPNGFLAWSHGLLQPGGHILFSIPNGAALERSIFYRGQSCEDIPRHLFSYTPETIGKLLRKSGFEDVRVDGVSRTAISEFQERTERAIFRGEGARGLKKLLYLTCLLPWIWTADRLAALFGGGHTLVVRARRPKSE